MASWLCQACDGHDMFWLSANLMRSQVENEDLVFTLEVIVGKFGDDIAPYAVNLAQNLTAAFWKYSGGADGDEDGDEDDQGVIEGSCCILCVLAAAVSSLLPAALCLEAAGLL